MSSEYWRRKTHAVFAPQPDLCPGLVERRLGCMRLVTTITRHDVAVSYHTIHGLCMTRLLAPYMGTLRNHFPVRHLLRKCVCIYVRSDDIRRASDPDGHVPAVEEAIVVIRCSRHLICGVYV